MIIELRIHYSAKPYLTRDAGRETCGWCGTWAVWLVGTRTTHLGPRTLDRAGRAASRPTMLAPSQASARPAGAA
eukprot:1777836-Prymnesium_polylepis.1